MKITTKTLLLLVLVLPVSALADGPYTICNGTDLCQIDLSSGDINLVGPIENEARCLVFHDDGFLYGIDFYGDLLVRIDPGTGDSTVVGPLGVDWPVGFVDCTVDDLGLMWCASYRWIYSIDTSTGTATPFCEQQNPENFVVGLDAWNGTLCTNAESSTPPPANLDCGLTDLGIQGQWIDNGPHNRLYSMELVVSPWTWEADSYLYVINPATGEPEQLAAFEDYSLEGLAFHPEIQQPAAVPALATQSALLLAVLLSLAGVTLMRRR